MKFFPSGLLLSLSVFSLTSVASAVPIITFDDSLNHNNYLNVQGNDIESTFRNVGVTLSGDLSNPLINPFSSGRITLKDILLSDSFASGSVESLASPASGGVFTLYNGATKLIEANLGQAFLTYSYTGTSGSQNDPIYVLRYDTSDLNIVGGTYSNFFAMGGFNGFLDLVFDNTAAGFMEFAGGSLYGASSHDCGNTSVPEPATMALLGAGGLAMLRKRKRA